MMNEHMRYRMYRNNANESSGGALMEPNAFGLAPTRSRSSALSKLPKSHFGVACLYQNESGYEEGEGLWLTMISLRGRIRDCLPTAREKRMKMVIM